MSTRRPFAILASALLALMLTACSAPPANPTVTSIPTSMDAATPEPSPTPVAAEPGTRSNPLPVGSSAKLAPDSSFSVGADAATTTGDGYVVLNVRVGIDWSAARAQASDVEATGLDAAASLVLAYVAASGRSYTTWDYAVDVPNSIYSAGAIYPPADSVSGTFPVNVPSEDIPGGVWSVSNTRGDVLFVAGP